MLLNQSHGQVAIIPFGQVATFGVKREHLLLGI
jgi:hypothetical protein